MSDIANNNLRLTCWNCGGIFGSFTYVKNLLQGEHWLYHDSLPFLSSLDTRFKVYATSSPLNNKNVSWRRGQGGVAQLWTGELIVKKCGATDRIVAIKVKTNDNHWVMICSFTSKWGIFLYSIYYGSPTLHMFC